MVIGIDASRALLKRRTGIEEYSYQVIKHLRDTIPDTMDVRLYIRSDQCVDFDIPKRWTTRSLFAPRLWTQARLSLEMLLHPPDVLFVPAHTVPLIHPERTIVTIHGLEYEFCPEGYSLFERSYMRFSIRNSVRWAGTVIAVSENTKRDLIRLYQVPAEKIRVVYEGFEEPKSNNQYPITNNQSISNFQFPISKPYLLFIGRLEHRKNIVRIIEAFEQFKEKTGSSHQLVLVGKPGYGYERIRDRIAESQYRNEIIETGYVSDGEKRGLLRQAAVFVFPSLYEGFGLPVIEAQVARVPVITATTSSLPEVAGEGALFVDPTDVSAMALAMERLATDQGLRAGIIEKATRNANRFSWAHCAREVADLFRR